MRKDTFPTHLDIRRHLVDVYPINNLQISPVQRGPGAINLFPVVAGLLESYNTPGWTDYVWEPLSFL